MHMLRLPNSRMGWPPVASMATVLMTRVRAMMRWIAHWMKKKMWGDGSYMCMTLGNGKNMTKCVADEDIF